uniref:G_PROTEIN_RECEP_F1_2 domain-containing protein n=1 Tax=Panagrellus redivivus TaxID=6233 RepID=A0A7E4ZSJ4_PANRE
MDESTVSSEASAEFPLPECFLNATFAELLGYSVSHDVLSIFLAVNFVVTSIVVIFYTTLHIIRNQKCSGLLVLHMICDFLYTGLTFALQPQIEPRTRVLYTNGIIPLDHYSAICTFGAVACVYLLLLHVTMSIGGYSFGQRDIGDKSSCYSKWALPGLCGFFLLVTLGVTQGWNFPKSECVFFAGVYLGGRGPTNVLLFLVLTSIAASITIGWMSIAIANQSKLESSKKQISKAGCYTLLATLTLVIVPCTVLLVAIEFQLPFVQELFTASSLLSSICPNIVALTTISATKQHKSLIKRLWTLFLGWRNVTATSADPVIDDPKDTVSLRSARSLDCIPATIDVTQ